MALTKIEAVNLMLDAIDEEPISSLDSGLPDAETAERFLDRTKKDVLAKGWHSNTDIEYTLTRDSSNEYQVPSLALRIDTSGSDKSVNVAARYDGGIRKLYHVKDQTFTFSNNATLKVDITWDYEFADLPHELQSYIAYHAARKFQESEMGSVALDAFTLRGEQEAYAALQDSEIEAEDANALTDNSHAYWITQRNNIRIRY